MEEFLNWLQTSEAKTAEHVDISPTPLGVYVEFSDKKTISCGVFNISVEDAEREIREFTGMF